MQRVQVSRGRRGVALLPYFIGSRCGEAPPWLGAGMSRYTCDTHRERYGISKDPRLAGLVRCPVEAAIQGAGRQRGRALPRVRTWRAVPLRTGAQVHALRRVEAAALRRTRLSRLRAERRRAGN